jgi:hypothetical protein
LQTALLFVVQAVPAPTHTRLPPPAFSQQPPPVHVSRSQHGWPAPPHDAHTPVAVPPVQVKLVPQTRPVQQVWPAPPHAVQRSFVQSAPALQLPSVQHAPPAAPQLPPSGSVPLGVPGAATIAPSGRTMSPPSVVVVVELPPHAKIPKPTQTNTAIARMFIACSKAAATKAAALKRKTRPFYRCGWQRVDFPPV